MEYRSACSVMMSRRGAISPRMRNWRPSAEMMLPADWIKIRCSARLVATVDIAGRPLGSSQRIAVVSISAPGIWAVWAGVVQ